MILGIDEVGRGPWAGPLVVGAVVLGGATIEGLTDSKKLSKKRREALDLLIREQADGFGLGWVDAAELDEIGLAEALKLATIRAVEQIKAPYQEIIIDGTINFLKETGKGKYVTTMPKADLLIPSVSAASIIAKVARDNFMAEQDLIYQGYGFSSHVGYGTAAHASAISKLGITPLHRTSFAPIAKHIAEGSTTKSVGDEAEAKVADYLRAEGHEILERNWKTKWCEIDIISMKDRKVYFTEVKYRKNAQQGGGMAAITPRKLRQMAFAAEYYTVALDIIGAAMTLAVATVAGSDFTIEQYLEIE